MSEVEQPWWKQVDVQTRGDVIIANVGPQAHGVAVGKQITQAVYQVLGPPTPSDKDVIDTQFTKLAERLEQVSGQLDSATARMAKFQIELLKGELSKTGEDETPSANTIVQVGDWLLDNVSPIAEALVSVFATPAVGKVVGKAGEIAVSWLRTRFGNESPSDASSDV